MLPASLQTPAAMVLIAGGILSCVAGYRVFRLVLGIYGFVVGALITSSFVGADQTLGLVVAALIGGVVGALLLIFAYFAGVALLGAGLGAFLVNVIWAGLGREPGLWAVVIFAVFGALAALALQRYVIILSTAFAGAWTTIVGGLAVAGERLAGRAPARTDLWLVYPLNPAPGERWVTMLWLALGVTGVVLQVAVTARGKKR